MPWYLPWLFLLLLLACVSHWRKKKDEKKKQKDTFEVGVTDKQNIIHEKAKFARRCQEQGQTSEAFITADHSFAEHCIYRMLKEELIRGRIIFGKSQKPVHQHNLHLGPDRLLAAA